MPFLDRPDGRIRYAVAGAGFSVLLFAPGGLRSRTGRAGRLAGAGGEGADPGDPGGAGPGHAIVRLRAATDLAHRHRAAGDMLRAATLLRPLLAELPEAEGFPEYAAALAVLAPATPASAA